MQKLTALQTCDPVGLDSGGRVKQNGDASCHYKHIPEEDAYSTFAHIFWLWRSER